MRQNGNAPDSIAHVLLTVFVVTCVVKRKANIMKKIKMNINNSVTAEEGFNIFLNHCKAKNYSDYTIKFYKNTIHNFSLFYNSHNELDNINKSVVEEYIVYLKNKELSDVTIATYIRGLRTILYYLMEEGIMSYFKIGLPKVDEKIKETYTDDELKALLKKPNMKKCSFAEYRNWVLVNYLLATGQRANSIVNIKIKDLDFDNDVVKLSATKGRKETLLPLSKTLKKILQQYLRFRKGDEDDYLFCNITGQQFTRSGLTCAIKLYNKSRGVDKTSIHLFRHTFAKNYLMNGGDVFRLQKLLCHKNIETTKGYLNLTIKDISKDYDKLNPLDSLDLGDRIKMEKS